jgi:hypothetical protein
MFANHCNLKSCSDNVVLSFCLAVRRLLQLFHDDAEQR